MTEIAELKEAERPHAPKIPGATEAHRRQGRHLAAIHRMHLRDMAEIRQLMGRIDGDLSSAQALAEVVQASAMKRNLLGFGSLCGHECNNLLFHHGAEDQQIFPILEQRGSDGLRAVVQKLRQEHVLVHALLDDLDSGARALLSAPGPAQYATLRATFEQLEAVLKSHFRYEETELETALGFHAAF